MTIHSEFYIKKMIRCEMNFCNKNIQGNYTENIFYDKSKG